MGFITKHTDEGAFEIVDGDGVIYFHVGKSANATYSSAVAASAVVATAQTSGSYGINNVLTQVGGTGTEPTWTVTHVKVMTAVVNAGGTGGTPGAVTITGAGTGSGTGTKFQATGTIGEDGILAGDLVVSVAGDYTVAPTSLSATPVTGGSLTGCTITITLGVKTVALLTAGLMTSVHANPVSTTVSPAGGVGCTLTTTMTFTSPASDSTAGYLTIPTATPASATAAGVAGSIVWDASFIYICTATNVWKKVAISSW